MYEGFGKTFVKNDKRETLIIVASLFCTEQALNLNQDSR